MDYSKLPTEKQNPKTKSLDTLPVEKILSLIDREDQTVPRAVRRVNRALARAVRLVVASLKKGGRLFFFGAGASGRLGILEAAECPPTFHTRPSLVQARIAGGRRAVFRSQEGAEDQGGEAGRIVKRTIRRGDVVVGVSASGVTPFVREALKEARRRRAQTILVACNLWTPLRSKVDILIAPRVGPEVIAGSTRLKAGTATKLILNRLTVASMVHLGKVYENRMVDLQPHSQKLKARALRLVQHFTRASERAARRLLRQAKGRVKAAILMGRKNLSYKKAQAILKANHGFLRQALRTKQS